MRVVSRYHSLSLSFILSTRIPVAKTKHGKDKYKGVLSSGGTPDTDKAVFVDNAAAIVTEMNTGANGKSKGNTHKTALVGKLLKDTSLSFKKAFAAKAGESLAAVTAAVTAMKKAALYSVRLVTEVYYSNRAGVPVLEEKWALAQVEFMRRHTHTFSGQVQCAYPRAHVFIVTLSSRGAHALTCTHIVDKRDGESCDSPPRSNGNVVGRDPCDAS
jgi:hypothetical protein